MTQTVVSRLVHRERLHCSVIHIFTSFLCVACPCRTISSVFISSGIKQWEFLNPINCERTKKKCLLCRISKFEYKLLQLLFYFHFSCWRIFISAKFMDEKLPRLHGAIHLGAAFLSPSLCHTPRFECVLAVSVVQWMKYLNFITYKTDRRLFGRTVFFCHNFFSFRGEHWASADCNTYKLMWVCACFTYQNDSPTENWKFIRDLRLAWVNI